MAADPETILDAALTLAEQNGWDSVHLHDVARALNLSLREVHAHYSDKDALSEAWFDRADAALLRATEAAEWNDLTTRERLHKAIFAWLDALAPHRRTTRSMLQYKFQPEHLHLQAAGAKRVSRTVQWIREVAFMSSTSWRRELEEAAITGMFLATVARWVVDESPRQEQSRRLLDRLLAAGELGAERVLGR